MSLLHINMILMTVTCVALLAGFSMREHRVWAPALMFLGVTGLMALIVYNIYVLSNH